MSEAIERKIVYYREDDGSEPVRDWLEKLKKKKKLIEYSKITQRIQRAGLGNFGDYRGLGGAFGELKIDFRPGYRVYFGTVEDQLIVLLAGGDKDSQQDDIEIAKARWEKYKKQSE